MPKRRQPLIIQSDHHRFIGRIFDLSIVGMYFQSYAEAANYPDAKYVLDVNERATLLTRRVESLNYISILLWSERSIRPQTLPIPAYDFCRLIQDAFLMRTVSIFDCCCLLAVEVMELKIKPRQANLERIKKLASNTSCCEALQLLSNFQFRLRTERNLRFHRGEERAITRDDITFQMMARFQHMQEMTGTDRHGGEVNLDRLYNEAITSLRNQFRSNVENLNLYLDDLYNVLSDEFERRFRPKFRGEDGFGRIYGVFRGT